MSKHSPQNKNSSRIKGIHFRRVNFKVNWERAHPTLVGSNWKQRSRRRTTCLTCKLNCPNDCLVFLPPWLAFYFKSPSYLIFCIQFLLTHCSNVEKSFSCSRQLITSFAEIWAVTRLATEVHVLR